VQSWPEDAESVDRFSDGSAGGRRIQIMSRYLAVILSAGLGCAPVGSLGKDGAADTGTDATTTMGVSSDSADSNETGSGGASSTSTTSSSSETSTGSEETASSEATGSSTGAPECPPDVDDDACTTCTKGHCCAELSACDADPTCVCVHECHAGGVALAECEAMCGMDEGENAALEHCIVEQCMAACP
jgi:hypothetical protein